MKVPAKSKFSVFFEFFSRRTEHRLRLHHTAKSSVSHTQCTLAPLIRPRSSSTLPTCLLLTGPGGRNFARTSLLALDPQSDRGPVPVDCRSPVFPRTSRCISHHNVVRSLPLPRIQVIHIPKRHANQVLLARRSPGVRCSNIDSIRELARANACTAVHGNWSSLSMLLTAYPYFTLTGLSPTSSVSL